MYKKRKYIFFFISLFFVPFMACAAPVQSQKNSFLNKLEDIYAPLYEETVSALYTIADVGLGTNAVFDNGLTLLSQFYETSSQGAFFDTADAFRTVEKTDTPLLTDSFSLYKNIGNNFLAGVNMSAGKVAALPRAIAEISFPKVSSPNLSLAGVDEVWYIIIDKLSDPLVPLFEQPTATPYVPESAPRTVPANTVSEDASSSTTDISSSSSKPSISVYAPSESSPAIVLDTTAKASGISQTDFYNALTALREEFLALNGATYKTLSGFRSSQSDSIARAVGNSITNITNNVTNNNVDVSNISDASIADSTITGGSATNLSNITTASSTLGTAAADSLAVTGNVTAGAFYGDGSHLTGVSGGSTQWTTTGSDIYYNTGNVGIGTASPTQMFQVNGNTLIGTDITGSSYGAAPLAISRGVASTMTPTLNLVNDQGAVGAGSAIDFYSYVDAGNGNAGARIGNIDDGNYSDALAFFTKDPGNSGNGDILERMRIASGGNVGIGSNNPQYKLDVTGSDAVGIAYTNPTGHALIKVDGDAASQAGYYIHKNGTEKAQIAVLGNSDDLSFSMQGTERMRLTNGGNVGIGTTNPAATLHTVGNVFIDNSGSSHGLSSNTALTIDGAGGQNLLELRDSGANSKVVFDAGGNLGIGTASPQHNLDVSSSGQAKVGINSGTNQDASLYFSDDSGSVTWQFLKAGVTNLWQVCEAGVACYFTMAPTTGYIGLGGEDSPGSNLAVKGNATIGSSYSETAAPTGGLLVEGNVGIGTTSPDSLLTVAGNVNITGALKTNYDAGTSGQILQTIGSGIQWVSTSTLGITSFSTSTSRGVFSATSPLSYDSSSGTFGVASGYSIPLTASSTNWNSFFNTPSTQITAGTGLSWSGNTLSNSGVTSIGGLTGAVSTSTLGITSSQWSTNGSNVYYNGGNIGIGTSSPDSLLTVAGGVNVTGALKANYNAGTNGQVLQTTGTGVQWVSTSTLGISGGGSSPFTDSGSYVYYSGSESVGIGTNSPQATTHIQISDSNNKGLIVEGSQSSSSILSSLAAYWKFDEGTGSTVTDVTGTKAMTWQGTLGSQWTTGIINSSGKFNGSNNSLSSTNVISGNDFTISFWVKTTQTGSSGSQWYNGTSLVDADVSGPGNDWGVTLNGSKVSFGVGNPDTTVVSGTSVNNGSWHLVTVTRVKSTGVMNIYIDGSLDNTTTGQTGALTSPTTFYIGIHSSGIYNGQMDELGMWNRALTSTEVSALYNSGSGNQYPFSSATQVANLQEWQNYTGSTLASVSNKGYFSLPTNGLTVGTNQLVAASNNIGIGTTSPDSLLTVAGNINITGALKANYSAGTNGQVLQSTGSGIQWVSTSTLGISGSGSSPFTDSGSYVYYNGSENVGIGTTTPTQKLDISGKIALDGTVIAYRPTSLSGTLILGDGGGSLSHVSGNDGYFNTFVGLGAGTANTTGNGNTANGDLALHSNTSGLQNTANGTEALYSNLAGIQNTANGNEALYHNTSGYYNTANGYQALLTNTTGSFNTANGTQSLYAMTNGNYNTANGYQALYDDTTGSYNSANGYQALYLNGAGNYNTGNGYQALYLNTGTGNSANGYQALGNNSSANYNTADGYQALNLITTGIQNTAAGYQAGMYIANGSSANSTGLDSLFLGANTKANANAETNEIVIGYNTTGLGSNSVVLGNDSIATTSLKGFVGIGTSTPATRLDVNGSITTEAVTSCSGLQTDSTGKITCTPSDQNVKQDITSLDSTSGISLIENLNPVSFEYKDSSLAQGTQYGFIAQDVAKILPGLVSKSSLVTPWTPNGTLNLNYQGLIAPLVEAVKEIINLTDDFKNKLVAWFGSSANGIHDLFVGTSHQQTLCVGDSSNGETCITKTELDNLLRNTGQTVTVYKQDAGTTTESSVDESTSTVSDATATSTIADTSTSTPSVATSTPDEEITPADTSETTNTATSSSDTISSSSDASTTPVN